MKTKTSNKKYLKICMSFEDDTLTMLDIVRGLIPRSTYVNSLIRSAASLGWKPQDATVSPTPVKGDEPTCKA